MAEQLVNVHDLVGRCPFATSQKLLAGKWSLLIMHELSEGPVRFRELERRLHPLKLQLLTYLLAVQKYADSIFAREALPAAMLYCFLTIPFITESKKLNEVELKKALAKQGKMPGIIWMNTRSSHGIDLL